ncbi:protoglobin domain-containing protein [Thiothrix lacustris]|uniref:protoglobin domain-containing protein n=1 Tax=Thiothrix lacustris TaxID=525917 RepID=UPI0027E3D139|nr:protoglobin domain-containing protein [Thiothrix lacustris]WMP17137.1 protoglobin domain-containing protein [Thiothrix lacustris]
MQHINIQAICEYARQFSGLDNEKVAFLHKIYPDINTRLEGVSDVFYERLLAIPSTRDFLEGRVESLKSTHVVWLHELFNSDFSEEYTRKLYHVGDVHVKVKLPVEFVAGAMTIIQSELIRIFGEVYADDQAMMLKAIDALNAATGFSLLIMQESYQSSSLAAELEKFLQITGMSRKLFDNLAKAYK